MGRTIRYSFLVSHLFFLVLMPLFPGHADAAEGTTMDRQASEPPLNGGSAADVGSNGRSISSGRILLAQAAGSGVDVLQVYGGGANRTRETLGRAAADVGKTREVTFLLSPGTWTIDKNLTLTHNITLEIPSGAVLKVERGGTLAIDGDIRAGAYRIFTGDGKVVFGSPGIPAGGYFHWWGVTTGDMSAASMNSAAMNKALTTLAGRKVRIPDGVYWVSDTLYLKSGTTMEFASWNAAIKMNSPTVRKRIINTNGERNITIHGGRIDGHNDVDIRAPHQCIALMDGSSHVTVENMQVTNCGQYGIMVGDSGVHGGAGGHKIINNSVDTSVASTKSSGGIEVFPKGGPGFLANPGIIISGNRVIGNDVITVGIKVSQNMEPVISNNVVMNVTGSNSTGGIDVLASKGGKITDNTIENVRLGIVTSAMPHKRDNGMSQSGLVISGNTVRGYSRYGVFAASAPAGLRITGNKFYKSPGGAGSPGIYLKEKNVSPQGLVIQRNDIKGGGIKLEPPGLGLGARGPYMFPGGVVSDNSITEVR